MHELKKYVNDKVKLVVEKFIKKSINEFIWRYVEKFIWIRVREPIWWSVRWSMKVYIMSYVKSQPFKVNKGAVLRGLRDE